ncbi:uncharacterized protein [Acropora muricata]|uniref:uncharacterized protein n=1 Tax=Acropora muricata TaxID=159855 RepID=UPI0034E37761
MMKTKREARSFGISILDAKECVAVEPLLWLSNPPQDHKIDVIVGHGVKLGRQVQLIKNHVQFQNCKWVHVVHTEPEDLSKYKVYSSPISRGEEKHWDEVDLCKRADLIVPVGPRLGKAYHSYLQECKKDEDFFELIPGLFEREFGDLPAKQKPKDESNDFIVLLCGRGDEEDFELKGYNTAVKAFADQQLKGKHYSLLFVGSPEGRQDEVRERLLKYGITNEQLTVREFVKSRERMKELFCEVDMVIMPSKSEGFGLVALEALSAGLPILVGSNSGFARAIKNIPLGKYSIVGDSGDPAKWAEAIEDVRDRHGVVLEESEILKEHYSKKFCWQKQCEELVAILWKMVCGTSAAQAVAADDVVAQCPTEVSESVCQSIPTTMQQHIEEGAVTSGRGQKRRPGGDLTLPELADHLIKLKIKTSGLNKEQQKAVYDLLIPLATKFMKSRNYSKVKLTGVGAFLEYLEVTYDVSCLTLNLGSLIIGLDCKTLKGLDKLWNDHVSGHLNKVAKKHLVYDEMIKNLNLRTINLKTTIDKKNYLNCRKILMELSREGDGTRSLFQQRVLDQGTSITGMATAADHKEVKQEDTDWMIRKEKAAASRSALHKASINGKYEEVKKYLSSGCAVDVKDQFLLTPLHLACWYGQESVVKLLLENGADVNATDRFQFTPLHKAERRNYQSIVKLLLNHKARPTFQQPPSLKTLGRRAFTCTDEHSGFNLLQAAVLEGDYDTVTKASVHLENFVEEMNCRTTGEKASIFPGKSAAGILLAVKWEMESYYLISKIYKELVETEKTLSRLHSCAKQNDVEMAIELVLNDGIDINVAAKRNITPLVWASPAASGLSIKTLIDLGADVNAQTFQESTFSFCSGTALRFAIHGNNAAVVKVLLANNADANIFDQQGNTVLHLSLFKRFFNISQLLIESGSEINVGNNQGETPLYCAVLDKNVVGVKLLLKNNADTNIQDRSGNTPLHRSTLEGFSNISRLLIDSGCKINRTNSDGETPLYSAVRGKNVADVEVLLQNDADANIQDASGNTPLHISTFKGFSTISQLLIDPGCTEINRRSFIGGTPLHSAVHGENVAEVELLLKNNADANIQDYQGNTPLHISTCKGFSNISQLLMESGCKINGRSFMGETPLHCAVRSKNVADVKLLLKNNADGNIQDIFRNAPLHISSHGGFSNISQLLMDSGCDKNLKNRVEPFSLRFGGDLEEDKANNRYASLTSFQDRIVFEREDDPWMNQRTLSTLPLPIVGKRGEQSSTGGSGDGGDFEEGKGNDGYESIKTFQKKVVVESGDVPLMNTRTPSTLSLPIVGKRREQSSTGGSDDGGELEGHKGKNRYASLKSFQEKIVVGSEDVPLMNTRTPSTLSLPISCKRREDKGNDGYESIKTFQEKIVVESGDVPLMNTRTRSTLSLPVFDEGNEQSSAEGSGDGGDLEGHRGKNRYASLKSFQEKIVVGIEDVPLVNTRTRSTLSLPTFDEENEQSSAEGSGMLFKSQQELSPSKKSKSKIRKAKRTTSRVEGGGTNRSKCEVM